MAGATDVGGSSEPDLGRRQAVLFDAYPHVYGGAQRTDHLLARGLPARGWDLLTLTTGVGTFTDRLHADGLAVEVVPVPTALSHYGRATVGARAVLALLLLPRYWLRLVRVLRRLHPTVAHVVDHRGLLLAGLPARLSGARLVWHVQAMDRGRPLNWIGARLAHCVVVPTAAVVTKMPGLQRSRDCRAVANVVPDHARRAEPVALNAAPVVVSTGRIHPDKGFDVLIEALALVRDQVPDVRVQIIGGPQDGFEGLADQLRAQAAAHGLHEAVQLVGFVDRPELLVAEGACYVQSARERTEILPLAILEAMATGIPVVATDVGGVRDLVRHEETGLLVPPEEPAALAAALVRVLGDRPTATRLRNAAFALAGEHRFTPAGLLDGMTAAYEGTADG